MSSPSKVPFGVKVPTAVRDRIPDFLRYMALVEAFKRIDTSGFDVVISTQPPSFCVEHPRHLALFYHHQRMFYDFSRLFVSAGLVDPDAHEIAARGIRRSDSYHLERVAYFLAGSQFVARRLERFNGIRENVGIFTAGPALDEEMIENTASDSFVHPLCVSRSEIGKRTELFVQAMKFLPETTGTMVGSGGRLPWVQELDRRLSRPGTDPGALTERDLWLNTGQVRETTRGPWRSNVRFLQHVTPEELARLYASALCVVAPAYTEDYGLTVIEAMYFGKPVIVCTDGGGPLEIVEDGVNGFIVEPDGGTIAEAVRRLLVEPELAPALGRAGRERVGEITWQRATDQLLESLACVAGSGTAR